MLIFCSLVASKNTHTQNIRCLPTTYEMMHGQFNWNVMNINWKRRISWTDEAYHWFFYLSSTNRTFYHWEIFNMSLLSLIRIHVSIPLILRGLFVCLCVCPADNWKTGWNQRLKSCSWGFRWLFGWINDGPSGLKCHFHSGYVPKGMFSS